MPGEESLAATEPVRSGVAALQAHPSQGGSITITVCAGCASTAELAQLQHERAIRRGRLCFYVAEHQGRHRAVVADTWESWAA